MDLLLSRSAGVFACYGARCCDRLTAIRSFCFDLFDVLRRWILTFSKTLTRTRARLIVLLSLLSEDLTLIDLFPPNDSLPSNFKRSNHQSALADSTVSGPERFGLKDKTVSHTDSFRLSTSLSHLSLPSRNTSLFFPDRQSTQERHNLSTPAFQSLVLATNNTDSSAQQLTSNKPPKQPPAFHTKNRPKCA